MFYIFHKEEFYIEHYSNDPCAPQNILLSSDRQDVMIINKHLKDINPVACGQHVCPPNYFFGPQKRNFYLLHFVVSGKGIFISKDITYNISRGQIFVIRPNEETFYKSDKENAWHYRWVGFYCSLDISNILHEDIINAPECEYLFRSMMDCDQTNTLTEYYICAKIFEILSLLSKNSNVELNKSYEYALKAKNYIESNYNDNTLTITSLANKLNLERSYFSTLFKKYIGKSPQKHLVDFRLNKAAEMISSNNKISDVATACGYSDFVNFSKMFKTKFGMSPSAYSKKPQKNR